MWLITLAVLLIILEPGPLELTIGGKSLDIWVQDQFYDFTTGKWCVDAHNPLGRLLFYNGPKAFVIIPIGVVIGILFLIPRKLFARRGWENRWFANKRALGLCIIALITIPLTCNKTKSFSNVYCPYDITRYGGHAPYIRVFEEYPADFARYQQEKKEEGNGFPAGHASGGFALMCLAMLARSRRWQIGLVCFGIGLGWWMGGYQMLRGAHYLSHTLVTWVVAAIVITTLAKFLPRKTAQLSSEGTL